MNRGIDVGNVVNAILAGAPSVIRNHLERHAPGDREVVFICMRVFSCVPEEERARLTQELLRKVGRQDLRLMAADPRFCEKMERGS